MFFAQIRGRPSRVGIAVKGGFQPSESGYVCIGIFVNDEGFIQPLLENAHKPDDFAF